MAESNFPKLNGPVGMFLALLMGGGVSSGTSILARDDSALETRLQERAAAADAIYAKRVDMSALLATMSASEQRDAAVITRLGAIEERLLEIERALH